VGIPGLKRINGWEKDRSVKVKQIMVLPGVNNNRINLY
jgi:hypothetical protein